MLRVIATLAIVVILTGCGGSTLAFPSTRSATRYWDQQIGKLAHGTIARDDGRGCAKTGPQRFTCAGWLRQGANGRNMIGVVAVHGARIHVAAHPASNAAMNHWLHRYRGAAS